MYSNCDVLPGESNHIWAVAVDLALDCLAVGAQGVRVQRLQVRSEQPDHELITLKTPKLNVVFTGVY
jgi:hypothetical protein